jgi:hypothetical protein
LLAAEPLIETGRFKYWEGDNGRPLSDGWWFWTQAGACTYDIPPDGHFERDLKWSVPANARVETPAGSQLVHDDRLISAALIAEVDRLYHQGSITMGRAASAVIPAEDPLANLEFQRERVPGGRRGARRCDRSGAVKRGGRTVCWGGNGLYDSRGQSLKLGRNGVQWWWVVRHRHLN